MLTAMLALIALQDAAKSPADVEVPLVEIARPIESRAPEAEALGHTGPFDPSGWTTTSTVTFPVWPRAWDQRDL